MFAKEERLKTNNKHSLILLGIFIGVGITMIIRKYRMHEQDLISIHTEYPYSISVVSTDRVLYLVNEFTDQYLRCKLHEIK